MSRSAEILNVVLPIDPPQSMAELLGRPLFQTPLDPKQHKLTEVLTGYSFSQEVPCGLSTCKQGHLHGFLVRTATGQETNIGHVCGKRHFGDDFTTAHSKYRRSLERKDALARLDVLKSQREAALKKVQELTDGLYGVHWVFALQKELQRQVGLDAYKHLCLRARREDYKVTRVKELSPVEIDMAMKKTGKRREEVQYIHEPVGQLAAMKFLTWDFRAVLVDEISEPFKRLAMVSADTMETKILQKNLRVFSGYEAKLETAAAILKQTLQILDPRNLRVLAEAVMEFERTRKGSTVQPEEKGERTDPLGGWERTAQYKALVSGLVPS